MTIVRVSEASTRAEIAEAIRVLRAKAERYARQDRRRDEIDAEVDVLVEEWLACTSGDDLPPLGLRAPLPP